MGKAWFNKLVTTLLVEEARLKASANSFFHLDVLKYANNKTVRVIHPRNANKKNCSDPNTFLRKVEICSSLLTKVLALKQEQTLTKTCLD